MTTTRRTCPSSGCGTSTCRRSRPPIDAGADTAMCSFNAINGVPGCGNDYLMNEILKGEWDFDGFVESDWTAVAEMRACPPKNPDTGECGHGVAEDGPAAAALALNSGVDSEMTSTLIRDFGAELLARPRDLDEADRRRRAPDPAREVPRRPVREPVRAVRRRRRPRRRCCARTPSPRRGNAASRSMVLLQNEGGDPAARSGQEDGSDRAAGQEPARHAGPVVGRRPRRRRRDRLRRHRPRRAPARPTPRAASSPTRSRRTPIPKGAAPTPASPRRSRPRSAADQVVLALGETREMSGEAERAQHARPARAGRRS